jgi:hypothetical protein
MKEKKETGREREEREKKEKEEILPELWRLLYRIIQ